MGADLSRGRVVNGCLRCPFHEWEFAPDGRCVHIPTSPTTPDFARQSAYPTMVRGGHVFFYNHPTLPTPPAREFEAPFFPGRDAADLLPARPIVMDAQIPWYMIGANGFDLQHFRVAHDRTLLGTPTVERPSPFARTIRAEFAVSGTGLRDRLTRRFCGPRVMMTVTSWCGTMIIVTAEFLRTTTYGMVCITPLDAQRCRLLTIVWVPRSQSALGRAIYDPLNAAVRRSFIRKFLLSDRSGAEGTRYNPGTLIAADAVLADYMQWLGDAVRQGGHQPAANKEGSHNA
jgi:hypothetical protein